MNRKHVLSALVVVGLVVHADVHADQDSGFYLGAGAGEVTDEADFNLLSASAVFRF